MPYKKWDEKDLLKKVSEDISNNKIVAWFQGGSEFGPRALGHRSIFANPCWVDVKKYLNEKIKYREGWRPYAPIVIEEELNEYFDAYDSPSNAYMLMSYEVKQLSKIPGVTHKDKTARVQTVNIKQNRRVYNLLKFIKSICSGKLKDYSLKKFSFEKDIEKNGLMSDVLKPNQSLLVQIVKEPISTKGPRITSELSIAGRYLVLVPFSNRISISQKIEDDKEKDRLKRLVRSIAPKGFGVIIRTVANGKKVAELDKDLRNLFSRWIAMCRKLQGANQPSKVMNEMNKSSKILRDVFDETFTSITVDDEALHIQIKDYVQKIAPKKESIVKLLLLKYSKTVTLTSLGYGVSTAIFFKFNFLNAFNEAVIGVVTFASGFDL